MVSLSLQNPFSLASHLIENGAILTLPGVPLIRHLVVEVHWLNERDAAFLVLGDDFSIRPEYVRFDQMGVHSFGVSLERGKDVIAVLTSLDNAAVPNPEEYRRGLQRWRGLGAPIPSMIPDHGAEGLHPVARRRSVPLATSL